MTRETSIQAYNQIKEEGLLSKLRFATYDVLFKHGPLTQGETWKEHFSSRQRHDIGPRFSELEKRGVIRYVGDRPCRVSGREARVYDVTANLPVEPEHKETNREKIVRLEAQIVELEEENSYLKTEIRGMGRRAGSRETQTSL